MNDKSIKQMAGYTLLYDWEWANEFSHISDNKIAWLKRGWTVRHSFSEMKCDHSIKIGAVWIKTISVAHCNEYCRGQLTLVVGTWTETH